MSKEAAQEFWKRVADDPDLQERFVAFAANEGYEFTVEELSDADLDDVAGGVALRYKASSSVMKTRHDTAKNAINNTR